MYLPCSHTCVITHQAPPSPSPNLRHHVNSRIRILPKQHGLTHHVSSTLPSTPYCVVRPAKPSSIYASRVNIGAVRSSWSLLRPCAPRESSSRSCSSSYTPCSQNTSHHTEIGQGRTSAADTASSGSRLRLEEIPGGLGRRTVARADTNDAVDTALLWLRLGPERPGGADSWRVLDSSQVTSLRRS